MRFLNAQFARQAPETNDQLIVAERAIVSNSGKMPL